MSMQTINKLSFKTKLVLFASAMLISGAQTMADV